MSKILLFITVFHWIYILMNLIELKFLTAADVKEIRYILEFCFIEVFVHELSLIQQLSWLYLDVGIDHEIGFVSSNSVFLLKVSVRWFELNAY